jgi:hypothetical protein
MSVHVAHPPGYEPDMGIMKDVEDEAKVLWNFYFLFLGF